MDTRHGLAGMGGSLSQLVTRSSCYPCLSVVRKGAPAVAVAGSGPTQPRETIMRDYTGRSANLLRRGPSIDFRGHLAVRPGSHHVVRTALFIRRPAKPSIHRSYAQVTFL